MFFNSNSGTINTTAAIVTFIIGLSISLTVALFHYYYFPQKYVEQKTTEMSKVFDSISDFPATAKRLLSSRNDIAYLKLLDQNGVLEESFGNDNIEGTRRFLINAPDNKTVVLGMYEASAGEIDSYALVWSLLIGAVLSFALIFFLFMQRPGQDKALKRMERAMERVSDGDLTARLDIDSSTDEEIGIMSAYQSFNRMVNTLNRKFGNSMDQYPSRIEDDAYESESDDNGSYHYSPFTSAETKKEESEKAKVEEEDLNESTAFEADMEEESQESGTESDKVVSFEGFEDKAKDNGHEEKPGTGETGEFRPRIVLPDTSQQPKSRMVTALVAKISDFERLTENLDSAELNSFLTSYRKAASTIIGDYGGVIEALLQDEIVALFNAPEEQKKPELRSICAAVEVLQVLAKMSKDRRSQGKPLISGKIGIDVGSVSFTTGSGIPNSVKNIVSDARDICKKSDEWRVQVSEELYDTVHDNVEVKENSIDGNTVYSVLGVEEGVIEL